MKNFKNISKNILKYLLPVFIFITIALSIKFLPISKQKRIQKETQEQTQEQIIIPDKIYPELAPSEIKGNIITLKKLRREYFEDYYKMLSAKVRVPLYIPAKIDLNGEINYLEKELKKEAAGLVFLYVIFDNKDNKLIGSVEIRNNLLKQTENAPGQFTCWINENYWGGGRLQEAVKLLAAAYFKNTKAKKFDAHVETWNLRSYYALKKAGFKLVDFLYELGQKPRYFLEFYNTEDIRKKDCGNSDCNNNTSNNNFDKGEKMKKILFILMPEKYRDEEFAVTYDLLKNKNYFIIDVAGFKPGEEAVGVNGYKFTPNLLLTKLENKDFDSYDALIIPGGPGSTKYLWGNEKIKEIVKYFHEKNKIVAAICFAAAVVAQSGILNGKTATVFPTDSSKAIFKENGVTFSDKGCVVDAKEKVITAQGPTFVKEFTQEIIKLLEK